MCIFRFILDRLECSGVENVEVEFGVLLNKHGTIETGYARVSITYHVASDYALRISKGYAVDEEGVASSLASLTALKSVGTFQQYPFLKISYCPPSEAVLGDGKSLVVVVYNPIGWKREEVVQFPVRADLGFDFFTLTFNVLAV
ncbi:putative alpha-mannosidase [Helianthus anomalus]